MNKDNRPQTGAARTKRTGKGYEVDDKNINLENEKLLKQIEVKNPNLKRDGSGGRENEQNYEDMEQVR